jgi:membrane-bound metal-dependent hydrolase YbcI (DUF457 family)
MALRRSRVRIPPGPLAARPEIESERASLSPLYVNFQTINQGGTAEQPLRPCQDERGCLFLKEWLVWKGNGFIVTSGAHIGAGVISVYVLEHLLHKPVTPAALGVAVGLSLLPDMDALWIRRRQRRQGIRGRNDHHTLFSHTPVFYLIVALGVALWMSWQAAMVFAAMTLVHLALDSWATDDGIMWLYPFRRKQYALLPRPIHADGLHGKAFYRRYYGLWHFAVAEAVLLVGGLIVTGATFINA